MQNDPRQFIGGRAEPAAQWLCGYICNYKCSYYFFYEILGGAHLSETEDRGLVYVEQLVLERF